MVCKGNRQVFGPLRSQNSLNLQQSATWHCSAISYFFFKLENFLWSKNLIPGTKFCRVRDTFVRGNSQTSALSAVFFFCYRQTISGEIPTNPAWYGRLVMSVKQNDDMTDTRFRQNDLVFFIWKHRAHIKHSSVILLWPKYVLRH